MRQAGFTNCAVKMFTINIINVLDKDFCTETEPNLEKVPELSAPTIAEPIYMFPITTIFFPDFRIG